jgi:RNA 3'-terminal phosphate cyclase
VLVIERATSFATTASQLKALEDQQIATTDGFAKLAMLRPRIAEAEHRQLEQALRVSELRRRNGLLNQRYKQVMFLGAGRCWVDYNERLSHVAKVLTRNGERGEEGAESASS